jgi:hypothetical protein
MLGFGQALQGSAASLVSTLFTPTLYTGTGSSRTISTGIDLSAAASGVYLGGGLVWLKSRNSAVALPRIFDTVRTAGKSSDVSSTDPEATVASLTSFGSGTVTFGVGTDTHTNNSGDTYVAWSYRRAKKFFDVITWTGDAVAGRTLSHGLTTTPAMIIYKRRDAAGSWIVYHTGMGTASYLTLHTFNSSAAESSAYWNGTAPTSSVFSLGSNAAVNASAGTYVAYLFADDATADGVIRCGSYTGNGSATGPTVTLGWQPQFVLIKSTTGAGSVSWVLLDTARGIASPGNDNALPATTGAEETITDYLSLTSTGFQITTTSANVNFNAVTYIYMAIRAP